MSIVQNAMRSYNLPNTLHKITERIDRITFIPEEYRSIKPPIPKSVKIELTARCDYKCFFCASDMRLREKSDMDFEFYKRVVKEMRELGVEELGVFYLGESFLCEWLPDAIKYAKEVCGYPYVFLTTNGRSATKERVKACMEAGLNSLKFSFNFADKEQFAHVTKTPEKNFEEMKQNIKDAKVVRDDGGYKCGIYASSIMYDGEQLDKMKLAIEEIIGFVDEHYWLPLYGQAGLTDDKHDFRPVAGNPGRVGALRPPLPCWAVFTEGHITFDGRLSACCFDHDGRFDMGNLNEMSFIEAWHSERFQVLREANLKKDVSGTACEHCIAYK